MNDKYYLVEYLDILENHVIYRTNIRSLAFEKVFNPCIFDWKMYVGFVVDGLFIPERLVARAATYTGV